jgi:DNA-binding NarL/FixJ family response regulator
LNVLIVDDSQLVAERLEGMLFDASNEIRVIWHAQSSAEGKQAIHCASPDAIILDIRMPGGSGFEVLEEARRRNPAPLVIVLTNYPFPQYRDRCMRAGADYFFDKSTQFDQVAQVLLRVARRRSGSESRAATADQD